jgi:hypothetical protein
MTKILLAGAALAGALALAGEASADGVKVGTLSCHEASGFGFIFGSSRSVRCVYQGSSGRVERYSGNISKFGVDIGYQGSAVILWTVVAPHSGMPAGALAGSYGGVTGSAAVGVGAGANVLIGGFDRSFSLQPVSIQGNTGLNVAAGIGGLTLHYVGGSSHHECSGKGGISAPLLLTSCRPLPASGGASTTIRPVARAPAPR